jgi:O-antigen/teichoic acid export membrane protein
VFEFSERSLRGLLLILLSPLFVLLFTPAVRPFRWSRLLLTYPVPVLPLVVPFDGVASTLRSYRVEELREIADAVGGEEYQWEVGYNTRSIR